MKKGLFSAFLGVCAALLLFPATVSADGITPVQPKGAGTVADPYQISTAAELYWFTGLVNGTLTDGTDKNTAACAKLMNDIRINENVLDEYGKLNNGSFEQWTPIGGAGYAYEGTFDGQNHTISGLYIDSDSVSAAGLFGCVKSPNGAVLNVRVADSYISNHVDANGIYAGGVCGMNFNFPTGSIQNCYHTGTVTGSGDETYAGGVCGKHIVGTIETCYFRTGTAVSGIGGGTVPADQAVEKGTMPFLPARWRGC